MSERDYNAALNIKKLGMDSLLLPLEYREVTPVEIVCLYLSPKKLTGKCGMGSRKPLNLFSSSLRLLPLGLYHQDI